MEKRVAALNAVMTEAAYLRVDPEVDLVQTRWCGFWLRNYFISTFSPRSRNDYTSLDRRIVFRFFVKVLSHYTYLNLRHPFRRS